MKVIVILVLIMLSSCTTIHYKAKGKIPTFISTIKGHKKFKRVSGVKEFYLWGLLPTKHIVYIDEEFGQRNYILSSRTEITEEQTLKNKFISLISLGLYIPKNYSLTSWGRVDR